MKIYYASSCSSKTHHYCWEQCGIRTFLFSYASQEALFKANQKLYQNPNNSIMVDSGAFSVWTKGIKLDLHEYADFLKRVLSESKAHILPVNLDVLPGKFRVRPTDAERESSAGNSFENYLQLLKMGIQTIPVFHQHERFEWLERILFQHPRVVGISPANDVSPLERDLWLRKVFNYIPTGVKCHGFGLTTARILERFPFYSVDSSSWLAPSLYGGIVIFAERELKYYSRADWRANLGAVAKYIKSCTDGYAGVTIESLRAYKALEKYLTRLWLYRGIGFEDEGVSRVSS